MNLKLSLEDQIETAEVINLYKANAWSSAEQPDKLISGLKNSDIPTVFSYKRCVIYC